MATAQAEFRIATVDIGKILNESSESVSKRKELDKRSISAKKQIDSKRSKLAKMEEKIKSGSVKSDSPEADRFRQEAKDFARYVKDTEEELKRDFMKSNRALTEKTLKVIKEFAKYHKIDLVLDKSSAGRGPVLFGEANVDITQQILQQLNG